MLNILRKFNKDFFSTLILVFVSGSPVLNNEIPVKFSVSLAIIYSILAYSKFILQKGFYIRYLIIGTAFSFVFFLQIIEFSIFTLGMIAVFLKMAFGGIIVYSLGRRFPYVYFRVMFVIALISLPFYASQFHLEPSDYPSWVPCFAPGGSEHIQCVLFHVYFPELPERNSGLFWEPGAFEGFLNLSLMLVPFEFICSSKVRYQVLIIVIATLTTLSTTGYFVLALIFVLKNLIKNRVGAKEILAILTICIISFISYNTFDHLGKKVTDQIDFVKSGSKSDFNPDRFGAFLFDLHYIFKRPLTGNGLNEKSRYADNPELQGSDPGHGNGFSDYIASMGLISFFAYFLTLFFSSHFSSISERIGFILFLVIILQGEHFLNLPLFLGLPFLRSEYKSYKGKL